MEKIIDPIQFRLGVSSSYRNVIPLKEQLVSVKTKLIDGKYINTSGQLLFDLIELYLLLTDERGMINTLIRYTGKSTLTQSKLCCNAMTKSIAQDIADTLVTPDIKVDFTKYNYISNEVLYTPVPGEYTIKVPNIDENISCRQEINRVLKKGGIRYLIDIILVYLKLFNCENNAKC